MCNNTYFPVLWHRQMLCFLCRRNNSRIFSSPAHNAFYLRVYRIAYHHKKCALFCFFHCNFMNLFHKWTGRIDVLNPQFIHSVTDAFRHSVGSYDHNSVLCLWKIFFSLQYSHTFRLHILDHFIVMNDRTKRIDLTVFILFYLLVHGINRTFHSKAKTGSLS